MLRLPKPIHNLRIAFRSPRWRLAFVVGIISDILSFAFVLIPPVQWFVDAATALILFVVLGFKWPLLGALVIEAIPALQVFPSWILVVIALAATENEKPKSI